MTEWIEMEPFEEIQETPTKKGKKLPLGWCPRTSPMLTNEAEEYKKFALLASFHWLKKELLLYCIDPGVDPDSDPGILLRFARESARTYYFVTQLGHTLISLQHRRESGRDRFDLHNAFATKMAEARGNVVEGLFQYGIAQEISIFESADYWLVRSGSSGFWGPEPPCLPERGYRPKEFVIGLGPEDLRFQLEASFDTSIPHDWGWKDWEHGDHIEFYDPQSRTYVRESVSGRTEYVFFINEENKAEPIQFRHIKQYDMSCDTVEEYWEDLRMYLDTYRS